MTSHDFSGKIAITGATGLVGSHVAAEARRRGLEVVALVRPSADTSFLESIGAKMVTGDMHDRKALSVLCREASRVVNCAGRVGDWGKIADFRRDNVDALAILLDEASKAGVGRLIHISSLGVYEPRDHFGTDENTLPAINSLDAYTRSKTEAEIMLLAYAGSSSGLFEANYGGQRVMLPYAQKVLRASELPPRDRLTQAVVLRPGFIYGERDRTVLPKLSHALRSKRFVFFGPGTQVMNSTYAGNIAQAVFLALGNSEAAGQVFNLTDGAQVSRREFVGEVAKKLGLEVPKASIPLAIAWPLATTVHEIARLIGAKNPPVINKARYKFLGLHLDFSIAKAKSILGYVPDSDWRTLLARSI